jgi:hypothetical protein
VPVTNVNLSFSGHTSAIFSLYFIREKLSLNNLGSWFPVFSYWKHLYEGHKLAAFNLINEILFQTKIYHIFLMHSKQAYQSVDPGDYDF